MSEIIFSVSDFVAVFNQTLEYAYPQVTVQGELANFRVSKNRWVYFNLKDDLASVKFFGTVYQLPGPLEDGLMLQVSGRPRLHPQYGFSINIQSIRPVGEGSIKKAAALLEAKLQKEGLFDLERKRPLPYPPKKIGLIASAESAAYHDFIKILNSRWSGVEIYLADVQVQGEDAPAQIIRAVEYFNSHQEPADVLVLIRGGGSPEDLAAFSTEQVTRAVAASRICTMVGIGHEVDVSLAELAADKRASTPSNAAELLVPDKTAETERLKSSKKYLFDLVQNRYEKMVEQHKNAVQTLSQEVLTKLSTETESLQYKKSLLFALNPKSVLERGYAIVRSDSGAPITSVKKLKLKQKFQIELKDGRAESSVTRIKLQ